MDDTSERRNGFSEMKTDIALIKQKMGFIEQMLIDGKKERNNFIKTSEFRGHLFQDRILFGTAFALMTGIAFKIMFF